MRILAGNFFIVFFLVERILPFLLYLFNLHVESVISFLYTGW